MAGRLDGSSVVVLLAEGFEDLEFWVTVMRLQEEDAEVTVAGLTTQPVHGKNGLEATADVEVAAVSADTVDAVVVPGGWAPDKLRRYDAVRDLVRHRGRQARHRQPGHQGRSGERGRDLGGRARLPRRQHRVGPRRPRHP